MQRVLMGVVLVESAALAVLAALFFLGGLDPLRKQPPPPPVFHPPLYDAVMGDLVRFEKQVPDGRGGLRPAGYLEYLVVRAVEFKGTTLGREFVLKVVEGDGEGHVRSRLMRVRPRAPAHGWLPPRFEEDDDYPPAARPVVKRIATAPVPWRRGTVPGFLVETVIPRESLTKTAERYWMTPRAAVFGVVRWERRGATYVLLRSERAAP